MDIKRGKTGIVSKPAILHPELAKEITKCEYESVVLDRSLVRFKDEQKSSYFS
jgi:hypothetical protein